MDPTLRTATLRTATLPVSSAYSSTAENTSAAFSISLHPAGKLRRRRSPSVWPVVNHLRANVDATQWLYKRHVGFWSIRLTKGGK